MLNRKPLRGRRVVVHTCRPDDQTIAGVMVSDNGRVVLEQAEYIESANKRHELENRVHIPVANVAWIEEVRA